MLIDVIIPTFNRQSTLKRAIHSVLDQTYQNFILHIVDDGSTDNTEAILKEFETHPKIRVHRSENHGVSHARNLGSKHAEGPWLSFLDSDDEWLPNKLEMQIEYLRHHPTSEFIHTEEMWIRNGVRVNPKQKHQKSAEDDLFERSLHFCIISPSTVLMSKKLFERHQGFNEEFVVCEDFDLWNKILAHDKVHFISTPLVKKYGGHLDQLSTQFVAMDYWRIKSLLNLYTLATLNQNQRDEIRKVIHLKSSLLLKNYLKHNNLKHHDEIKNLIQEIMPDV